MSTAYHWQVATDENVAQEVPAGHKKAALQHVKRAPLGDISNQIPVSKHAKNALKPETNSKPLKHGTKPLAKDEPPAAPKSGDEPAVIPMELDDIDLEIDEVDAGHLHDPQWVAEYASDIYDHYFRMESVYKPVANYMDRQQDIRPDMRRILIDWLVEIHNMFKLKQETLFLAINMLDRYLAIRSIQRTSLQLIGSVALFVSSKYEELLAPDVDDFVYVSDKAFTRDDLLMCESEFCSTLEFIFSVPTAFHFSQRFVQVAEFDERSSYFTNYLMELSLLEYSFLAYLPSVIAASAVYLTTYFDGQPWADHLIQHTRYLYPDIRPCVKEMYALLASDKSSSSVAKKYSSKSRKRVTQIGRDVVEAQLRQHQEQAKASQS